LNLQLKGWVRSRVLSLGHDRKEPREKEAAASALGKRRVTQEGEAAHSGEEKNWAMTKRRNPWKKKDTWGLVSGKGRAWCFV